MESSGLRGQVGAVESPVAVRSVSGWRIKRLVEDVMVIVEDGGGADVLWERGCREGVWRGVNKPMMLIVSPVRISVYVQSSRRITVRRSSPGSNLTVKFYVHRLQVNT
jgi:hypothetical protein